MHYAIAAEAFKSLVVNEGSGSGVVWDEEENRVSERMVLWAHHLLEMGMDGAILVDVLEDVGHHMEVEQQQT